MAAYVPQINSPERVREEFRAAAENFRVSASEVLPEDQVEPTLEALSDETLSAEYTRRLDLVHRFVVAEFDTDAPSKRGMARLADGDPPPRIGAKYRKKLRDEQIRADVGLAAERLVIVGFGAQAVFYDSEFGDTPEEEIWLLWLRHIMFAYNEMHDLTSRVRKGEESDYTLAAMKTMLLSDHGGSEMIEGFEGGGIMNTRRANTWGNARALSYTLLLLGAGRSLQHVLSDKVDPRTEAYQPLHLLENYAEKRGKRQMKAEI